MKKRIETTIMYCAITFMITLSLMFICIGWTSAYVSLEATTIIENIIGAILGTIMFVMLLSFFIRYIIYTQRLAEGLAMKRSGIASRSPASG